MRQLLLALFGRIRRGAPHVPTSGLPLMGLALMVLGCASPSLIPGTQASAIRDRDRALASHRDAIHAVISQSGDAGALAFLDASDGRLIVLPGDSPADAWSRHATSPESVAGRVAVPSVLTFVHRTDVPKAPETVTRSVLQQHQTVAILTTELRDARRRIEERLDLVQRELAEATAATQREAAEAIAATQREAAARADMQIALTALSDELTSVRTFMLQTAQLGWLNHELALENASGLGQVATASQELSASSERLEETMRQLATNLAGQLKELSNRLDTIHGTVSSLK